MGELGFGVNRGSIMKHSFYFAQKSWLTSLLAILLIPSGLAGGAPAQETQTDSRRPQLVRRNGSTALMVDGQPFHMVSGELHNSSSSSLEYMKPIWPKLGALNLNSVIASLSWELVEPVEGQYDFKLLDGLIASAREQNMRLALIWFATWKNGDGTYIPAWVKTNTQRFARCQHIPGRDTTQLSALCEANMAADARAFAAVMSHIRKVDSKRHTVIMMQVENESGVMPVARDHGALAEAAFAKPVPAELMRYLIDHKDRLNADTREIWERNQFKESGTWSEVFGADADEVFMSWNIGRYIGTVASAGKAEYALPMYANAWLVQFKGQKAGEYPSGGPVAKMHDIWRAAAPAIDLLAPDIYLDDFKGICREYTQGGNPLFIPEARLDKLVGRRAYYAFGAHDALCFAPFGIDELAENDPLREHYAVLQSLLPLFARHPESTNRIGFLQSPGEKSTNIDIGDFRAEIEYSDQGEPGAGLVLAIAPDTFVMIGVDYSIRFGARSNKPGNTAWLSIDEGVFVNGQWKPGRRLNGDEASWRVRLGHQPQVLIGRVYRY